MADETKGLDVAVVGAGAIGSLVAGVLAKGGARVSIVARQSHAAEIKVNGLQICSVPLGTTFMVNNIDVLGSIAEAAAHDLVLVTVKVPDLDGVLAELELAGLDPGTTTLGLVQNGAGNEELVRARFPDVPLFRVITSNGATLDGPGKITHAGIGDTYVGCWDDNNKERAARVMHLVQKALAAGGLESSITDNIKKRVWEKVIVNAGINALGAIYGVPNGTILDSPALLAISDALAAEATAVAKNSQRLQDIDGVAATRTVLLRTRANRNSMLQDIERGRKTEVDFINGAVAKIAPGVGVDARWNEIITAIVHGFEETRSRKTIKTP